MWIGLDRWNTNSKKWSEGNFNKLDGNEIIIIGICLSRGLKDRHWEEITKKTISNTLLMKALRFRIY